MIRPATLRSGRVAAVLTGLTLTLPPAAAGVAAVSTAHTTPPKANGTSDLGQLGMNKE